jgi:hypothetical protein
MPFNPFMPLMGDPYMPPGLLGGVRQQQQPTFRAVSHRPQLPLPLSPPMEDYRAPTPQGYAQARSPIDVATPPQPAPTGWWENLQKMLQGATAGIDPARTGLQGMFGQQQPRTIQTTDPGAGYGMSPSGPTARLGSEQFPDTPRNAPRVGTWMHGSVQRPKGQAVIEQYAVPTNYGSSPSNPNWRKPMSPFYEPPPRRPTGGP